MEPLPLELPEGVVVPEKSDTCDDKSDFLLLGRWPLRSWFAPREEVNMLVLVLK